MIKYIQVTKSTRPNKRYTAIFYNNERKKVKTVHFGYDKGSTYIDHKDDKIKNAWIARHRVNGTFDIPTTASSLAYYILWTEKTFEGGLKNFLNRFNLYKY